MKAIRLPFCIHGFTLSGLNLERFLNTLQKEKIPLLLVKRMDQRTLRCECYSADLGAVAQIAQDKGWRMSHIKPLGFSAWLHGLKARPGLAVGAVLALALVVAALQFVWLVQIHDAGPYRAEIAAFLSTEGYGAGKPKAACDVKLLEQQLTRRYPQMAWFHVYVTNVTLVVDCTRGVPMPEQADPQPGDLLAQRDGLVDNIQTFAGTAQVKPGDIVRQGQVLIAGWEQGADGAQTPVQARGVVMARCWKQVTAAVPLREVLSGETGSVTLRQQLCTPWFSLPAQVEAPEYLAFNTYEAVTPIVGCFFPCYVKRIQQREVWMEYGQRSLEQVKQEAAAAAWKKLKAQLREYDIIDKWADYCMIEGEKLAASVTAEWLMDIGGGSP